MATKIESTGSTPERKGQNSIATTFDDRVTEQYLANRERFTDTDLALERALGEVTPAGGVVIDLGCGDSRYTSTLHAVGAGRVIGLDVSLPMLIHARARVVPAKDVAVLADVQQLPVGGSSVDVAVANFLFHYLQSSSAVTSEVARVLKPGGFFITVLIVNDVPDKLHYLFNTTFPLVLGGGAITVQAFFKSLNEFRHDVEAAGLFIQRCETLSNPAAVLGAHPNADKIAVRAVLLIAQRPERHSS